jgi:hypothetical protein
VPRQGLRTFGLRPPSLQLSGHKYAVPSTSLRALPAIDDRRSTNGVGGWVRRGWGGDERGWAAVGAAGLAGVSWLSEGVRWCQTL